MGDFKSILVYVLLGVIAVATVVIYIRRKVKARKKYEALTRKWTEEGFVRRAVSKGGAALFVNKEISALILVRVNTEKFKRVEFGEIASFSVYDDNHLLMYSPQGEEVKVQAPPKPVPGKKNKCDKMVLTLRRKDGALTELSLNDAALFRDTREYREALITAEKFMQVMLEIQEKSIKDVPSQKKSREKSVEDRLCELKQLEEKGLISEEQYKEASGKLIQEI